MRSEELDFVLDIVLEYSFEDYIFFVIDQLNYQIFVLVDRLLEDVIIIFKYVCKFLLEFFNFFIYCIDFQKVLKRL